MEIVRRVSRCRELCRRFSASGERLALVTTMGALHDGHLSLIRKGREIADRVVVSVFVNPLQFGPGEDFELYPRSMTEDVEKCRSAGVDLVFHPEAAEIYPENFSTAVEVGKVTERLCGVNRPGHFRGVATVVTKLLNIVRPDFAVFGLKDAQQTVVLRRLIRDLNIPTELVAVPIVRDPDGVAISSRNQHLSETERKAATVLHRALVQAEKRIEEGERNGARIEEEIGKMMKSEKLAHPEYISLTTAKDLIPIKTIQGRVLIALAVRIGNTRLIDNVIVEI